MKMALRTTFGPLAGAAILVVAIAAYSATQAAEGPPVKPGTLAAFLPKALSADLPRSWTNVGYRNGTAGAGASYKNQSGTRVFLMIVRARTAKERFDWRTHLTPRLRRRMTTGRLAGEPLIEASVERSRILRVVVGGEITVFADARQIPAADLRRLVAKLDFNGLKAVAARTREVGDTPLPVVDGKRLAALLPDSIGGLRRTMTATRLRGGASAFARYRGEKARATVTIVDARSSRGAAASQLEEQVARGRLTKSRLGALVLYEDKRRNRIRLIAVSAEFAFAISIKAQGLEDQALREALKSIDVAALKSMMPPVSGTLTYRADLHSSAVVLRYPATWYLFERSGSKGPFRTLVVSRKPVSVRRMMSAGAKSAMGDQAVIIFTPMPNPDGSPPADWLANKRMSPPKTVNNARADGAPKAIAGPGRAGAMIVYRGTDGAGKAIVNPHLILRTGQKSLLHVHALFLAAAPKAVRDRIAAIMSSVRIESIQP